MLQCTTIATLSFVLRSKPFCKSPLLCSGACCQARLRARNCWLRCLIERRVLLLRRDPFFRVNSRPRPRRATSVLHAFSMPSRSVGDDVRVPVRTARPSGSAGQALRKDRTYASCTNKHSGKLTSVVLLSLTSLPTEILEAICDFVPGSLDLKALSLVCRPLRNPAQASLFREIVVDRDSTTPDGLAKLRAQLSQLDRLEIPCERLVVSSRNVEVGLGSTMINRKAQQSFELMLGTLLHHKGGPKRLRLEPLASTIHLSVRRALKSWTPGPNELSICDMILRETIPWIRVFATNWSRWKNTILEPVLNVNERSGLTDETDSEDDSEDDSEEEQDPRPSREARKRARNTYWIRTFATLKGLALRFVEMGPRFSPGYGSSHYLSTSIFSNCTSLVVSRHLIPLLYYTISGREAPSTGWPLRQLIIEDLPDEVTRKPYAEVPRGISLHMRYAMRQDELVRQLPNLEEVDLIATNCIPGLDPCYGFEFTELPRTLVKVAVKASAWESLSISSTISQCLGWLADLVKDGVGKLEEFRFQINWSELHRAMQREAPAWTESDYEDLRYDQPELCKRYPWDESDPPYEVDILDDILTQQYIQDWRGDGERLQEDEDVAQFTADKIPN